MSPLTRLEPQQTNHRVPHLLRDGDHFLYYAQVPTVASTTAASTVPRHDAYFNADSAGGVRLLDCEHERRRIDAYLLDDVELFSIQACSVHDRQEPESRSA